MKIDAVPIIHKSDDIQKCRRAYLLLYSHLSTITSSKVKRTRILEKQTSMTRISEASNSLRLSGSEAFIPPFHKCLNKYRSREKLDTVFIMEFMRF